MWAPVHCAAGSDREMNFGLTGAPRRRPHRPASQDIPARRDPRPYLLGIPLAAGTDRCLLASAAIRLASTANPSPLTRPSRCTAPPPSRKCAQHVALAKAPMSVARERRVVWHPAVQPEVTKPAIGEIEVNFVAQPPLGPDAHAVADNQHPHHQFGINRRPADLL